jgi:hypothetical protein
MWPLGLKVIQLLCFQFIFGCLQKKLHGTPLETTRKIDGNRKVCFILTWDADVTWDSNHNLLKYKTDTLINSKHSIFRFKKMEVTGYSEL